MICVLDVTHGPARGRRFWIRTNETVQIGRISTADFSVPSDRHMSRHHLILEGGSDAFRVRDVGSANGTFVNDAKVTVIELCNGDRIKAGETVFEVSVLSKDQNPYAEDELTVSAHGSKIAAGEVEGKIAKSNHSEHDLDQEADHGPSNVLQAEESPAGDDRMAEYGFVSADVPGFFAQDPDFFESVRLQSILSRIESTFVASILVNTSELRRFDRRLLEKLESDGLVTWHSDATCSILACGDEDFYTLVESLLGQDIMVLVATENGTEPSTLRRLASLFTSASKFGNQLNQAESELNDVIQHFDFAIWEQDATGRLLLLLPAHR